MTTRRPLWRRVALLGVALGLAPASGVAGAATDRRVVSAERLVAQLDLANTDYAHAQVSVTWSGTVALHTDCSGFIDNLLMHEDGLTADDFKRWLGSRRPTAERYHDAIAKAAASIDALRAGDLIAIKYSRAVTTPATSCLSPRRRGAAAHQPDPARRRRHDAVDGDGGRQLGVGHGPTDTRRRRGANGHDHDGLGRGVFRLYGDAHGEVAGFPGARPRRRALSRGLTSTWSRPPDRRLSALNARRAA